MKAREIAKLTQGVAREGRHDAHSAQSLFQRSRGAPSSLWRSGAARSCTTSGRPRRSAIGIVRSRESFATGVRLCQPALEAMEVIIAGAPRAQRGGTQIILAETLGLFRRYTCARAGSRSHRCEAAQPCVAAGLCRRTAFMKRCCSPSPTRLADRHLPGGRGSRRRRSGTWRSSGRPCSCCSGSNDSCRKGSDGGTEQGESVGDRVPNGTPARRNPRARTTLFMGDAAEREDHFEMVRGRDAIREEAATRRDLGRRRLVGRRNTPHRVGHHAIHEGQTIVGPFIVVP